MKNGMKKWMVAAIFAMSVSVQANASVRSKTIIVDLPSDLPEMAQRNSEAIYLHETGGGKTLLYLEQDQGRTLGILDVTDPGAIRAIAQVSIPAKSTYDFVGTLNGSAVLIYYRDYSGFAVINLKKYKLPVLAEAPQLQHPAQAEPFGQNGLVLTSSTHPVYQAEDPQYQLIDVSNPTKPTVLANVEGVQQRLERTETGTTFFLTNTGLAVIRRLNVEEEYKIEQFQKEGN